MEKKRQIAIAGVALLLIGLVGTVALASGGAQTGAASGWNWFRPAVAEYSGTLEGTMVPVQPENGGRVTEILVEEGQEVHVGDVIARMDDRAAKIAVAAAQAEVRQGEAKLTDLLGGSRAEEVRRLQANREQFRANADQVRAVQAQYEANLERDRTNLAHETKRLQEVQALYEGGALSQRDYDLQVNKYEVAKTQLAGTEAQLASVRAQVESAQAQVASAQAGLDLALAGATGAAIEAQKAAVQGAQERLRQAELTLQKLEIASPVNGRVLHQHVELGQVVSTGSRIATILNERDLWVKVYVPEAKLGTVAVGAEAQITVDAYPGQHFAGVVTHISEKAEFTPRNMQTKEARTTLVFAVKVQVREGGEQLKPGMPADVRFP
ncbi:HlyD family secretion protein [Heliophilum fasciatum]|uniref:HlyD family secretion protein n=1 Tax=Heliophilum fasciatum TaxID=35700 RepID=A0A4R2RG26_9FIRM|nr:HlyD family efflux transporter periplasmic adaptor subunit [Heliophilum fasciatum]MCW2279033.1 HlyD family secretion protein [Heliophilum fasciatum]TCP61498.1 HlyD family secretion protein [Heliophilum fasciatum]